MMTLGIGLGITDPSPVSVDVVLGGATEWGGGGSLWTPDQDPNLVLWYQADSYREVTVSTYTGVYPQDKLNNTANRELVHITAPTGNNDLPQIDDTTYDFPVFVFNGKGVKTTDTFRFADMDVYLLAKIITPGGNTSRYIDHDYGNGFWLGTGATSGLRIAGVRQGSSPYGYGDTPPNPGSTGWFLMQLQRQSISADDYNILFCSDDGSYKIAGNGSSGLTNSNGVAVGSELGGNSGVPVMHVAAVLVYRRSRDTTPPDSRQWERAYKRQGWLGHQFPSIKDDILNYGSIGDHPYYDNAPVADEELELPGTPKYHWNAEENVYSDAGTTPITNGTGVYQINNQMAASNHLVQTTSGNRPAYRTNGALHYGTNGRAVVHFDGSDDYMEAAINLTASTNVMIGWAMANGNVGDHAMFSITDSLGSGTNFVYIKEVTPDQISIYVNGGYRFTVPAPQFVMNSYVLHWDGTDWNLYVNGVEQTPYTGSNGSASVATKLFLAQGFHGAQNNLFGEFVIYDNVAGVPDAQELADYLAQRWS